MKGKRLFKMTFQYRYRDMDKQYISGELCVAAKSMRDAIPRAVAASRRTAHNDGSIFLRLASLSDQGVIH